MRRYVLASLLLTAGCGQLVEDSFAFEYVSIESPLDGATVLGREVFPVEVFVECPEIVFIEVRFDGVPAGLWGDGDDQATGCPGNPGTYCVATSSAVALGLGAFWPARMDALLVCANRGGDFTSGIYRVHVAPFDGLAMVPGRARSLFAAPGGGVIAASGEGLHRVGPDGTVSGLLNRSPAARAFAIGDDLYYYAPCDGIACAAEAADLFRVDPATLAARGEKTRLECAPLAMVGLGDARVSVLGGCDAPRVRWSAADLSDPVDEPIDAQLTEHAARRGDEVVVLAWRGDELVIGAAGAPPLAMRPTGVRGARAALSDDGARAAVLDAAGRLVQIDTATGATVAAVALLPHAAADVVALAYAPAGHRVIVALRNGVWIVDGDAAQRVEPPVDDYGVRFTVRAAAPLDGERVLVIADPVESWPPASSLYVIEGAATASRIGIGGDWALTAPPYLAADGILHLAFDTLQGPVVVSHRVGAR